MYSKCVRPLRVCRSYRYPGAVVVIAAIWR
jgi:hypothetical protein